MKRLDAARIIDVIDNRIKRLTRSMAMVETTWGVVAARDVGARTVDVYLYGSATASEDFRIIGGGVPAVDDVVKVAINKITGDRWVMEPINAAGSSSTGSPDLSHNDLIDVTADQHHAEVHAIDGADHTGNLSADQVSVTPFATIASTDVQAALEEVYAEASGGVSDHGALTGLGDDDHPQYDTHAEVLATKLDDFAAPDDNTDLDASTSRHGLVPKVTGSDGDVPTKSGTGIAWGPGGASAAMVPYLLPTGTFTVPAGKQALFADAIELVGDATLDVEGELIEVDAPKAVETGLVTTSGVAGQVPTANGLGALEMRYPAIPGVHMLLDGGGEGEPGPPGPQGPAGPAGAAGSGGGGSAMMPEDYSGMINDAIYGPPATPLRLTDDGSTPVVIGNAKEIVYPYGSVVDRGGGSVGIRQVPYGFIGAKATGSSTSIGTTGAVILFPAEDWDTDGFHSISSNTGRMTIPAGLGGKYLVMAHVMYVAGGSEASTEVTISKNGEGFDGQAIERVGVAGSLTYQAIHTSVVLDLVAGDYVEAWGRIGSGTLTVAEAWLSVVKLDAGRVGSGIGAKAIPSSTQGVSNGTMTPIAYGGTDVWDTDGFHDPASNNTRMTIPAGLAGKYLAVAHVNWAANSSGERILVFWKNGSEAGGWIRIAASTQGSNLGFTATAIVDLAAGDYLEIIAYQTSGGSLNVSYEAGSGDRNSFSIMRIDSGGSGGLADSSFASATTSVSLSAAAAIVSTTATLRPGRYRVDAALMTSTMGSASSPGSVYFRKDSTQITNGVSRDLRPTAAAQFTLFGYFDHSGGSTTIDAFFAWESGATRFGYNGTTEARFAQHIMVTRIGDAS